MKKLPRFVRADILDRTADIIESRKEEIIKLIAGEAGKPRAPEAETGVEGPETEAFLSFVRPVGLHRS